VAVAALLAAPVPALAMAQAAVLAAVARLAAAVALEHLDREIQEAVRRQ
jgi:hypothetical protein